MMFQMADKRFHRLVNSKLYTLNFILSLLFLLIVSQLFSTNTASAVPFSGSYLQRSSGVEALYWNPADIGMIPTKNEIIFLPTLYGLHNNVLSKNTFEKMDGAVLSQKFVDDMLDRMHRNFMLGADFHTILFGFSHKNFAFSTGTNVLLKTKLDSELFRIAVKGNKVKNYKLEKDRNSFFAVAYQDFTAGYGSIKINDFYLDDYFDLPEIYAGISASYLYGLAVGEMTSFNGRLSIKSNDMYYNQSAVVRYGLNRKMLDLFGIDDQFLTDSGIHDIEIGDNDLSELTVDDFGISGSGIKLSLAFSSMIYEYDDDHNISVGLVFDNIMGNLIWKGKITEKRVMVYTDTLRIDDIGDEIYDYEIETDQTKQFKSRIPFVLRMGTLYTKYNVSYSLDYAQNIGKNNAYIYYPDISLGLEYILKEKFPLQMGIRLPIGEHTALYSLGCAIRLKNFEYGMGVQSVRYPLPSYTNGFLLSAQIKFRFEKPYYHFIY